MPNGHRIALVLDKVGERLGIALLLLVVAGDRGAVLVAAEDELRLLLALRRVRGDLPERGQAGPHDRNDDHEPDVGEAPLLATSAHSPSLSYERRTRCPFSRQPAAPPPRCSRFG